MPQHTPMQSKSKNWMTKLTICILLCLQLPPETSFYCCRDPPEGTQDRCVAAERLDLEVKLISDLMTMSDVREDVLDIRYLKRQMMISDSKEGVLELQ